MTTTEAIRRYARVCYHDARVPRVSFTYWPTRADAQAAQCEDPKCAGVHAVAYVHPNPTPAWHPGMRERRHAHQHTATGGTVTG